MAKEQEQVIIRPQAGFQEMFVRSNVDFVVGGGVLNSGKAQPLDSLVLTPFGYRKMGDLKVGDTISNPNGGPQKVIQIHERGVLDTVELYFADGRKVQCAKDHLWKARRCEKQNRKYLKTKDWEDRWFVMTTEQIMAILDSNRRKVIHIPNSEPIIFTKGCDNQGLTIHPYVLGCLLGDGCLAKYLYSPMLTSFDDEIVEKIRSLGYDIRNIESNVHCYYIYDKDVPKILKQKRLWGKKSHEKFIPPVYKTASLENRIELLQGLLDTDGNASKDGDISYYSTSKRLVEDVAWIVRSLGGNVTIKNKQGKYKNAQGEVVECKVCYVANINISEPERLFHLKRKKDIVKLAPQERKGSSKHESAIVGYKILEPQVMRCITVSNPNNLYITNDFIVTHNSFGAVLSVAEPSLDGRFRACFFRNNLDDLKAGGGILDTFTEAYGEKGCKITESGNPHVDFPSGARVDVTHLADQDKNKILQRFKGRQYDLIYFDEGTGFTWTAFVTLASRNRGKASWTGKMRMTTNPKRSHWLRKFLDWYIGADGFIREDRNGKIRYFYINGETVDDVVWGDTKAEVYAVCKAKIDAKLKRINRGGGKATYEDLIKSFTFYLGSMSENKASLERNPDYVGSVAMMGEREAQAQLEGNWNVDADEDLSAPIPSASASHVFMNDPARNGDGWVTADLADTGTDNFLALAWDGLHIIDKLILTKSTPRMNAEQLEMFAAAHNIANNHIIYDAVRGTYINDYIQEAIPYVSYRAPMGLYGRMARQLKDECYMRLVEMIKREMISVEEAVAMSIYEHQNMKEQLTFQAEFLEECAVVRFKEAGSGKLTLLTKKEMNAMLGKGRSMDLLDPMAMRMLPLLEYPYGEELTSTLVLDNNGEEETYGTENTNIYDDTFWS